MGTHLPPHPGSTSGHDGRPISGHILRPPPATMDGQQAATSCAHLRPQWTANKRPHHASTSGHDGRPISGHIMRPPLPIWPTTLGHHSAPRSAPTSTVPGRPTLAVRGFHLSATATSIARLGGRPKFAALLVGHTSRFRAPILTRYGHPISATNRLPIGRPDKHSPSWRSLDYHPS